MKKTVLRNLEGPGGLMPKILQNARPPKPYQNPFPDGPQTLFSGSGRQGPVFGARVQVAAWKGRIKVLGSRTLKNTVLPKTKQHNSAAKN